MWSYLSFRYHYKYLSKAWRNRKKNNEQKKNNEELFSKEFNAGLDKILHICSIPMMVISILLIFLVPFKFSLEIVGYVLVANFLSYLLFTITKK